MSQSNKVLMVFIEPTPYILDLMKRINKACPHAVDVFFLKENITQHWNLTNNNFYRIIPHGFLPKIKYAFQIINKKYALIHLAGWRTPLFILIMLLAKRYTTPIVVESDTPIFNYSVLYKRIFKKIFYPHIFELIDLFLPGGIRQSLYIQQYGVKADRIKTVQMTVDVTSIQNTVKHYTKGTLTQIRDHLQIPRTAFVFIFVGRLLKIKGIKDLISAFNQLQNPNCYLLFVGEGELDSYIQMHIKTNHYIRWAGRKSGDELLKMYYASDVLVLPSHKENWGLVVNEAMAVGKSVIISDKVGCGEDLVLNNVTGLITQSGNVGSLTLAMQYMLNATPHRLIMQKNCLQKISNWTLENEATKICQAWKALSPALEINPI